MYKIFVGTIPHAAYCLEMDSNTQICNGSKSAAKKLVYYIIMYLIILACCINRLVHVSVHLYWETHCVDVNYRCLIEGSEGRNFGDVY